MVAGVLLRRARGGLLSTTRPEGWGGAKLPWEVGTEVVGARGTGPDYGESGEDAPSHYWVALVQAGLEQKKQALRHLREAGA
jgi:hypothetical protein